jgi:hypothetical protein
VNEQVRILPFEKYLEATKAAMDREVFPGELSEPQALIEEFAERIPAETLRRLSSQIQSPVRPSSSEALQGKTAS